MKKPIVSLVFIPILALFFCSCGIDEEEYSEESALYWRYLSEVCDSYTVDLIGLTIKSNKIEAVRALDIHDFDHPVYSSGLLYKKDKTYILRTQWLIPNELSEQPMLEFRCGEYTFSFPLYYGNRAIITTLILPPQKWHPSTDGEITQLLQEKWNSAECKVRILEGSTPISDWHPITFLDLDSPESQEWQNRLNKISGKRLENSFEHIQQLLSNIEKEKSTSDFEEKSIHLSSDGIIPKENTNTLQVDTNTIDESSNGK